MSVFSCKHLRITHELSYADNHATETWACKQSLALQHDRQIKALILTYPWTKKQNYISVRKVDSVRMDNL